MAVMSEVWGMKSVAGLLVLGTLLTGQGCGPAAEQRGQQELTEAASGETAESPEVVESTRVVEAAAKAIAKDRSGRIVTVDFRGTESTADVWKALPQLPALQALLLTEVPLNEAACEQIGKCASLRNLDVRDCPLENKWLEHWTGLKSLQALRLSGKSGATSVDDDGLAAVGKLSSLKVLALDYLWVSGTGLEHLAGLTGLQELYLAGTLCGDEDLEQLKLFPQLKKLRVSKLSQVTGAGMEQIAGLKQLEELDLSENSALFDDDVAPLAGMTTLKKLNLWRVAITDVGVGHLQNLVHLEWLNLDNTQMTDAGLPALKQMTALTFLHLGSTAISDAGLPELAGLKQLKDLKVTRTAVTPAGVAALQAELPNTEIQLKYLGDE